MPHAGRQGRGGGGRGGGGGGGGWRGGGRGGGGICYSWRDTGYCRFGSNCKFPHVGPGGRRGGRQGSSRPQVKKANDDAVRYIEHLSALSPDKIRNDLINSASLWRRCWTESKALDNRAKCKMVEVLTKIPGSSSADPPPVGYLEGVFQSYLGAKVPNNAVTDDVVLTAVKTVMNALTRLLFFEWDVSRDEVKKVLSSIAFMAEGKLRKGAGKDHRLVSKELMELVDDMEKPWRILMKETPQVPSGDINESTEETSFSNWQQATVEWLCNPTFFSPACCPVMKVGAAGVYESAEEYMEVISRLWIAMTFADGFGALAPKCHSRGQNGSCQNALWPIGDGHHTAASTRCRRCSEPASFACRIHNHDALCESCATRSINCHLAPEGPKAATHVYDAVVETVSADGTLYVSNSKSRNAPPQIHWRTTKRLSPPNLVGVVRLEVKGAALVPRDSIKWGEIAFHGHARNEDQERAAGKLAVNLSSITGDFEHDYFDEGNFVAIIDCMTFVPEWIPVLRALENQKQARLPFENGKYLNLWKETPVDNASSILDTLASPADVFDLERRSLIDDMIDNSQLEPIREIRRDETLKEELVVKLETLVKQATLDTMQLVSFVDSLRNPVHLTQGPPGTGKSYLGVVIVRALLIIRSIWLRKSKTVGTPPILVLSYKNHAIDEFLVDLTKVEPLRGKLIRIGGQCKDSRLVQYSESNTYLSDFEVKARRKEVERLDHLRESIASTLEGPIASFQSFRHIMSNDELDERQRRKAATDATVVLMYSLGRWEMLTAALDGMEEQNEQDLSSLINDFSFLELSGGRNDASVAVNARVNRPDDGVRLVPSLIEGVSHYDCKHWGDALEMWVSGKVPLPQCRFIVDRDNETACGQRAYLPDAPLCDRHRCQSQTLEQGRCLASCKSRGVYFCFEHCCDVEGCRITKLFGQKFCEHHACRRCISLGCLACLADDEPPYNVCEVHPLCRHPFCVEFPVGEGSFCADHEVVKCLAKTKKGRPCKGKPQSRSIPFCMDHFHLRGMYESAPQLTEDGGQRNTIRSNAIRVDKCSAKTEGMRCEKDAMPGSGYCYAHSPLSSSAQMETLVSAVMDGKEVDKIDVVIADAGMDQDKDDCLNDASSDELADEESLASSASSCGTKSIAEFDEMDLEDDHLQHLRDVFEVGDREEEELMQESNAAESSATEHVEIPQASDPKEWSWDMSIDERWNVCQVFLEHLQSLLRSSNAHLKCAVIVARKNLYRAKTLAKARVYENKSIIGGTMVGCISRLESIRATRPFAVIVEEASEVLEPLLFSCLSESTLKLEMIGDHRQLQPSAMSRHDFEICNKINVSMFQRLIEAPSGHGIPSTVLSIQRRMRKNICDLTRGFYRDVTEIKDHESCDEQVIGRRGPRLLSSLATASATGGREVPGIGPHLFLWTHDGMQGRAKVGVSRINAQEALMACSLASYLVSCGVPRTSIVLLTPYKGQLMEIRNLLLKDKRFSSMGLLSRDPSNENVCRVSTVDRFQGDEEDIVIGSLVVDEKSKTGFVKLINRMIVLLSRARIGMYILGNIGYFENAQGSIPAHWARTFTLLQSPSESDSSSTVDDKSSGSYSGIRTGNAIPLCCPKHRFMTFDAASASDLQLGFCTEICVEKLPCGHACSLPCHWPNNTHNKRCSINVASPCPRHDAALECHNLFENAPGATDVDNALSIYKCPLKVEGALPCGHEVTLPCWKEAKMASGQLSWPSCNKQSPEPYRFPECGHTYSVTCEELVRYTENPALVKCEEDVTYDPNCGHPEDMKCWKREQYLNQSKLFVCGRSQSTTLPRCGHTQKVPCRYLQQVEQWTGQCCEEKGKLFEETLYGPPEFPALLCKEPVSVVRKCGHQDELPCHLAFKEVARLSPCREPVTTRHPKCGHQCCMPCTDTKALANIPIPEPTNEYYEGQNRTSSALASLRIPIPKCAESVKFVRKCGHIENVKCSQAWNPRSGCVVVVGIQSPLCGHSVDVPCGLKSEAERGIWPDHVFVELCNNAVLPSGAEPMTDLDMLPANIASALTACDQSIGVVLGCGHEKIVRCQDVLALLSDTSKACDAVVTVQLRCGHITRAKCFEASLCKQGSLDIDCNSNSMQPCWNCNAELVVPCGFADEVGCEKASVWECQSKKHSYTIPQCKIGPPLDCPGCSMEYLDSSIDCPGPFSELEQLGGVLKVVEEKIEWVYTEKSLDSYIKREQDLLNGFRVHFKSLSLWERTVFDASSLKRVPCFRILKGANKSADSFDPKKFAKPKTICGIQVKELCSENLSILAATAQQSTFTILVGYASVCRTMPHPPNKLPSKSAERAKLFQAVQRDVYDSLHFVDEKGSRNLIIWEPFPLAAVCRIQISGKDLLKLSEETMLNPFLFNGHKPILHRDPPKILQLSRPPHPDVMTNASDDEDDEESVKVRESLELLGGTILDGLEIDLDWARSTCCIFSRGELPPPVEEELETKMQFVNPSAPPFAAVRLLKTQVEREEACPQILHLLLAAEYIKHSLKDSKKALKSYVQSIRESDSNRLHPWALIIAARLEGDDDLSLNLLRSYDSSFPMKRNFLTEEERKILDNDDAEDSGLEADLTDVLLEKWSDMQREYPIETKSDAMDKLLKLTGLRKVKQEAISVWKAALQLRQMDAETRKQNLPTANYCFTGNPGTGKTTVARLFAEILCDSGIRKKNDFVETTAQKAKDGGTDEFNKLVQQAVGGVLFIDEAYDLDPSGDYKGRPIVNEILTLCENRRDELSVIMAGYEDEIQKKLYGYNEGLKSRFIEVRFDDFDGSELARIWTDMRREKKWEEADGVCAVFVRRMLKKSGQKGFGNAREVRRCLEAATKSAMDRLSTGKKFSQAKMSLEIQDVIGEDPRLSNPKLKAVLQEIAEKIGWHRVKEKVDELIKLCGTNYHREMRGEKPFELILNRMLLGNPGTGKTTFAKLYGRLLKELGFLTNGDVVSKTASDFVGSHVGESQNKTLAILEGARGKVLIIDEAYALDDGQYGKQVLDTFVEKIQGPSDDIAVLLLGYEDPMIRMINEQNPGLGRRFPKEQAFYFDDYGENELVDILDLALRKAEVSGTIDFKVKALDLLRIQKSQSNFGNAGSVEAIIRGAMLKMSRRIEDSKESDAILQDTDIEDPGSNRADKSNDPLTLLDNLFRMEGVKEKLQKMQKTFAVAKREGDSPPSLGHFVFAGSPGTGKTTVARVLATILFGLGLKPSSKIVETSGLKLTGQHVGETKKVVEAQLKEAKGGILFIDEAYTLGEGIYGKEAVDSIVEAMTSEEYSNVTIVIAGYSSDINNMLNANAGLKSRFTESIEFEDWEAADCRAFFDMRASKEQFSLDEGVLDKIEYGCKTLIKLDGWGNGRDVMEMWRVAKEERAERVFDQESSAGTEKSIILDDVKAAVKKMIEKRVPDGMIPDEDMDPLSLLDNLYRMDNIRGKLEKMQKALAVAKREGEEAPKVGHFVFTGSPGTGKTTVARVLAQILCGLDLKPSSKIVETSGLKLTGQHVGETKKVVEAQLKEAKGGILFIDEAYTLGEGIYGKEAVDSIVEAMTSEEYSNVTIVIAGYSSDINNMLNANAGLKSRFTESIEFEDWEAADCRAFFDMRASKEQFSLDEGVLDKIEYGCKTLIKLDGWGNGRDVMEMWRVAKEERAERVFDQESSAGTEKSIILDDVKAAVKKMIEKRVPDGMIPDEDMDPLSLLDNLYRMDNIRGKLEKMQKALAVAKREGEEAPKVGHFVFTGSPGTGKTTVARVLAQILCGLDLKPSSKIVETSGLKLTGQHVGETKKVVEAQLKEAKGGILFIDEAYTLGEGIYGKEAVDSIVEAMTSEEYSNVTIVIAGYSSDINNMLNANAGLKSRFTESIEFEDWEAADCRAFFDMRASKEQFSLDEGVLDKIEYGCKTLIKLDGWGNGRDVMEMWRVAKEERAERVFDQESSAGTEKSIILDDVKAAVKKMIEKRVPDGMIPDEDMDPLSLLDNLYRMDNIRGKLEKMQKALAVAKREGEEAPKVGHFVFTGSPGTGKTTVARVLAQILCGLDLKPSSKIVETSGLKLTGQHVGETKKVVEAQLKEAKGGILFIDEAYTLGEGIYGKEAVDSIVEAMTSEEYSNVTIVIAGYSSDINNMLNANAGLKSRFTESIEFEDWEAADCRAFFDMRASKEQFSLDEGVLDKIEYGCKTLIKLDGWGNGRDVMEMWRVAKEERAERVFDQESSAGTEKSIILDDVKAAVKKMIEKRVPDGMIPDEDMDPLSLLDNLYRMDNIRGKLEKMQKALAVAKREGEEAPKVGHFVFTGSPGTGKTTVARVLAQILCGLDLKPSSKIVETSGLKLTGQHVGETKKVVEAQLKEAKGGILFIDEAYTLGEGIYGKEAVDSIVEAMTSEEYSNVTIVIAGYSSDINNMLNANAGLKSRFTESIEFEDWEAADCRAFFDMRASKEQFSLDEGVLDKIEYGCKTLIKLDGWGNGRDVMEMWRVAKEERAERVFDQESSAGTEKSIILDDVKAAVKKMIEKRSVSWKKRRLDNPQQHRLEPLTHISTADTGAPSLGVSQSNRSSSPEVDTAAKRRGREEEDHRSLTGEAVECPEEDEQGQANEALETEKDVSLKKSCANVQREAVHQPSTEIELEIDRGLSTNNAFMEANDASAHIDDNSNDDIDDDSQDDDGKDDDDNSSCCSHPSGARDDGVPDDVWGELEQSKEEERQRMETAEKERIAYEDFLAQQKRTEEGAKRRLEEELARIQNELEREEQDRAIRQALEEEERRRNEAALARLRRELEEKKRIEKLRQKEEIQRRLQRLNPCPMGYKWFKQDNGWRCSAGGHFVSDEQLRKQFMSDI